MRYRNIRYTYWYTIEIICIANKTQPGFKSGAIRNVVLSGGINEIHGLDYPFFQDGHTGVAGIINNLIQTGLFIRGIFTQNMPGDGTGTPGTADTYPDPNTCLLPKSINN